MKKIQNILLAVAAVLAVSCEKDAERLPFDNALEISSEGFGGGNGKAVVGGSASYWVDEEQVRVNGSTCVIAVSSEKAYVDAEGLASPYVAIYPASILADEGADLSGGGTVTVNIPSVFNYETEGGRQKLDVPMYSCNHFVDGCLYFKHLTGAITVMLTNNTNYPLEVDSIIVTNSAYQLSGSKSITLNAEGNGVAVDPAAKVGDNNRVVVLGNGKLTIPANTTGQANAVDVQVPVLPVGTNNSAFTIRVRTHRAGTVGAIIFQQSQDEGNKHLDQGKIGYAMAKMDGNEADHMTYVGLFTINARNKKVFFSKGNLQWSYDNGATHAVNGGGTAAGTWRFAEHQYIIIGDASGNNFFETTRSTQNAWIDLFGWGTSGWNNGNSYYQPYCVNKGDSGDGYGYGPKGGSSISFDLTGAYSNADWGVYNAILNGGNEAGIWHVFSSGQWDTVLTKRSCSTINSVANSRFAKAKVCGVQGIILFPDFYIHPEGVTLPTGINSTSSEGWYGNTYDASSWLKMEGQGAVFLPVTGRTATDRVENINYGYYWSSSYYNYPSQYYKAYNLYFASGTMTSENNLGRFFGFSVRLVQDL